MTDELDQRIRDVVCEVFGLARDEVGPDTSSDTVEAWDSLQHLTLVLSLEEEFEVRFDDDETVALVSVPLIREILGEHLRAPG